LVAFFVFRGAPGLTRLKHGNGRTVTANV
jgi:hypothetical protein